MASAVITVMLCGDSRPPLSTNRCDSGYEYGPVAVHRDDMILIRNRHMLEQMGIAAKAASYKLSAALQRRKMRVLEKIADELEAQNGK